MKGRKRHIVVDTLGLLLAVTVHPADIQDRDGARLVLRRLMGRFPRLQLIWADGAYGGKLVAWAQTVAGWTLELVRRPAQQHTFQVLPRRWVVERTFGWLNRQRRLSKDYEALCETTETWIYISMTGLMLRRLARIFPLFRHPLSSGTQWDRREKNHRRTIAEETIASLDRLGWDGLSLAYGVCGKWIVKGRWPHWLTTFCRWRVNWAVVRAPLTHHRPLPELPRMPSAHGRRGHGFRRTLAVFTPANSVGLRSRSPITPPEPERLSQHTLAAVLDTPSRTFR